MIIKRITQSTDHNRQSGFLFQRLSGLIQRYNATTSEDET